MKVLIVCSKNSGKIAPFIVEQAESLVRVGLTVDYFTVKGKGIFGYLANCKSLINKINSYKPDLIHAHYGLLGLLANLQRRIPVITTYHGSDINDPKIFPFSWLNMLLSAHNIFVSEKNQQKAGLFKNNSLIPCGVDLKMFKSTEKTEARELLGLEQNKNYILFAGAFDNKVKNAELAIKAVDLLNNAGLLELKDYIREQVALLMNAVDAVLMTSFTEGSPQIIKEALACNCPVVSVPVGDVPEVIEGIDGCYISSYDPTDVAEKLKLALNYGKPTKGRKRIIERGLDGELVAKRILEVYRNVMK